VHTLARSVEYQCVHTLNTGNTGNPEADVKLQLEVLAHRGEACKGHRSHGDPRASRRTPRAEAGWWSDVTESVNDDSAGPGLRDLQRC